jgi:hypothetical protein
MGGTLMTLRLIPEAPGIGFSLIAVESIHQQTVCPYPGHLLIDVLPKIGYVKNATSIVQSPIHQLFSEGFEDGQRDLSLVRGHGNTPTNNVWMSVSYFPERTLICAILNIGAEIKMAEPFGEFGLICGS